VSFNDACGLLTHLFFLLVVPEGLTTPRLRTLVRIRRLCRQPDLRVRLCVATEPKRCITSLCSDMLLLLVVWHFSLAAKAIT